MIFEVSFTVFISRLLFYIVVGLAILQFIVDGMLGKLARWLRLLGHDVHYYRDAKDNMLIDMAKSGKRVLLTRDLDLVRRAESQDVKAISIEAENDAGLLAGLARHFGFGLDVNLSISRCSKCNGRISAVSKGDVASQVPEMTYTFYDEFWKCLGCGQVYWRGAHWKKILMTLEDAKGRLQSE